MSLNNHNAPFDSARMYLYGEDTEFIARKSPEENLA